MFGYSAVYVVCGVSIREHWVWGELLRVRVNAFVALYSARWTVLLSFAEHCALVICFYDARIGCWRIRVAAGYFFANAVAMDIARS